MIIDRGNKGKPQALRVDQLTRGEAYTITDVDRIYLCGALRVGAGAGSAEIVKLVDLESGLIYSLDQMKQCNFYPSTAKVKV